MYLPSVRSMGRIDVAIPIRRTGIERLSSKLPPLSRLLTALGWALTIDRATRTSIVQSITQKVHYFLYTLLPLQARLAGPAIRVSLAGVDDRQWEDLWARA